MAHPGQIPPPTIDVRFIAVPSHVITGWVGLLGTASPAGVAEVCGALVVKITTLAIHSQARAFVTGVTSQTLFFVGAATTGGTWSYAGISVTHR